VIKGKPWILAVCLLIFVGQAHAQPEIRLQPEDGFWIPQIAVKGADLESAICLEKIPMYARSQPIAGSFASNLSCTTLNLFLGKLDFKQVGRFLIVDKNISPHYPAVPIWINESGKANFVVPASAPGIYAAHMADKGKIIASTKFMITEEEIRVQAPEKVSGGAAVDLVIQPSMPEKPLIYSAVLVPWTFYQNLSLVVESVTVRSERLGFISSSRYVEIPAKINRDFLMSLMNMMPADSTMALQESSGEATLYLITDSTWPKEKYIITCAVFSKRGDLVGINQRFLELT